MLGKAISIAAKAFENTLDKGGKPYILHCLKVMDMVRHLGEEAMICAVLHDLLEDCPDWTTRELRKEGFSEKIILVLLLLKHNEEVSYEDYINRLAVHPLAREIKKRDLEHNSKITRLKGLREKDFERLKKYHKAYAYLSEYK